MKMERLKEGRAIFPVILFGILIYIIINNKLPNNTDLYCGVYFVCPLLFGLIYGGCNIRDILWKPIKNKVIDYNVVDSLNKIYNNKYKVNNWGYKKIFSLLMKKTTIYEKNTLNDIYKFVSQNETIKDKSKLIMSKGFFLTCFLDIIIIVGFALFTEIILTIWNLHNLLIMTIFLLSIIFAFFISIYIIKLHIDLCNDQLKIVNEIINGKKIKNG